MSALRAELDGLQAANTRLKSEFSTQLFQASEQSVAYQKRIMELERLLASAQQSAGAYQAELSAIQRDLQTVSQNLAAAPPGLQQFEPLKQFYEVVRRVRHEAGPSSQAHRWVKTENVEKGL